MSRLAVRIGAPTTTGGIVISGSSDMFSNDKPIALDGDKATCGNCTGTFPIVGSAVRMISDGQCMAIEGDAVLCPCGQNRLMSGSDCTFYYENDGGRNAANSFTAFSAFAPVRNVPEPIIHDDQFVIRDARTKRLSSNMRYWIKNQSDNVLASGVSDWNGCIVRVQTERAQTLKLVIIDTA